MATGSGKADETSYGRLVVVSGPSGVGKDAVLERLFRRLPGVVRSVSATTRAPRPGEVDGEDYHFLTFERFEAGIAEGYFLEFARYGENYYGTPARGVAEQRARGLDVILKIEVQGALEIRALVPDAIFVFIQPPSMEELERRLRGRGTDSEETIRQRLTIAASEMTFVSHYDYAVINDTLDDAVDVLRAIFLAERHRVRKP